MWPKTTNNKMHKEIIFQGVKLPSLDIIIFKNWRQRKTKTVWVEADYPRHSGARNLLRGGVKTKPGGRDKLGEF